MDEFDLFQVRPLLGDRRYGFEEFCCQLARRDDRLPDGSRYVRLEGSGGDGGVECYWVRPDQSKWGYQSKLIGDLDKSQIEASVMTALRIHPTLSDYTVCLPFDLTGPTGRKGRSQQQRWEEWVAEWSQTALAKGRKVNFELWGRSHLLDRLLESDPTGGRSRFWFDATRLTEGWFSNHILDAAHDAGPRYHPELNVKVPLSNTIDALGQTPRFRHAIRERRRALEKEVDRWAFRVRARAGEVNDPNEDVASTPEPGSEAERLAVDARVKMEASLPLLKQVARLAETAWDTKETLLEDARGVARRARELIADARGVLRDELEALYGRGAVDSASFRQFQAEYQVSFPAQDYDLAETLLKLLYELAKQLNGEVVRATRERVLLITGVAGAGKTHAVCDAARNRLTEFALPSVLILGEKLVAGDFWEQIRQILGLPGNIGRDELLAILDAAGEAAHSPLVIFIDAINEREPRSAWKTELASVITQVKRHPSLSLCLTCRTTYIESVLAEGLDLPIVEHRGFAEVEFEAVFAFFTHFGLQAPSVPLLQPEYSNPLFLRTLCVAVAQSDRSGLPGGPLSMSEVVELLLSSGETIAERRLDVDARQSLVHRAVNEVVGAMRSEGRLWLPWEEANQLVNGLLPGREKSRSLLDMLLHEGLLTEVRTAGGDDQVRFGFERLGEYLSVKRSLKGVPREELPGLLTSGGLLDLRPESHGMGHSQGIAEALAILLPEQYGLELTDLPTELPHEALLAAVVNSLPWRDPESFSFATEGAIREALTIDHLMDMTMEQLLGLATRPSHPLGVRWFHQLMLSVEQPYRDQSMAAFIHFSWEQGMAARRLATWALREDLGPLSEGMVLDWAQTLLWLCLSPDRRVRDNATMGVVALLSRHPKSWPTLFARMNGVDDEYVLERTLLAAYGSLIRLDDAAALRATCASVWSLVVQQGLPLNALIRDHVRSIVELAANRNSLPDEVELRRIVPPYESLWPKELKLREDEQVGKSKTGTSARRRQTRRGARERSELPQVGDDGPGWRKVVYSITDDDFAVYTLPRALKDGNRPSLDLESCKRWLLAEIQRMGFGGEGFDHYDSHMLRNYGGGRGRPSWADRIGKKYQWIALARLCGLVGDHIALQPEWSDEQLVEDPPSLQAEHLRDLDPTLLLATASPSKPTSWWAPVEADLGSALTEEEWLDALRFPDSLELIEISDRSDGSQWLALHGSYDWDNRQNKEDWEGTWRNCWLQLRSYLVPADGSDRFWNWLRQQNFNGRWMPESASWVPYVFEGEYPWSTQARRGLQPSNMDPRDSRLPSMAIPSTIDQSLEFEYDAYHEHTFHLFLPAPELLPTEGQLRSDGLGGYMDSAGEGIFRLPNLTESGPQTLIVRREWLNEFLRDRRLRLVWTVLSELQVVGEYASDGLGYSVHSRAHRLRAGHIESSSGITQRRTPGRSRTEPGTQVEPQ